MSQHTDNHTSSDLAPFESWNITQPVRDLMMAEWEYRYNRHMATAISSTRAGPHAHSPDFEREVERSKVNRCRLREFLVSGQPESFCSLVDQVCRFVEALGKRYWDFHMASLLRRERKARSELRVKDCKWISRIAKQDFSSPPCFDSYAGEMLKYVAAFTQLRKLLLLEVAYNSTEFWLDAAKKQRSDADTIARFRKFRDERHGELDRARTFYASESRYPLTSAGAKSARRLAQSTFGAKQLELQERYTMQEYWIQFAYGDLVQYHHEFLEAAAPLIGKVVETLQTAYMDTLPDKLFEENKIVRGTDDLGI